MPKLCALVSVVYFVLCAQAELMLTTNQKSTDVGKGISRKYVNVSTRRILGKSLTPDPHIDLRP